MLLRGVRRAVPLCCAVLLAVSGCWWQPAGGAQSAGAQVCRTFAGLTREQQEVCQRRPAATSVAIQGLHHAIQECQFQFRHHRWNCSSLATKNRNPHASVLLQRGYRESAFAYAISAAGVAHAVARACSLGRLLECACATPGGRRRGGRRRGGGGGGGGGGFRGRLGGAASSQWQWGGCSHNIDFGVRFSRLFLDVRERAGDLQSRINLHNNQAGRLALSGNTQLRCKCHGMSGSCELKTCWRAVPDFRRVGDALMARFRSAVLVDQSNLGSGSPLTIAEDNTRQPSSSERSDGAKAGAAGGRGGGGGGAGRSRGRRKRRRRRRKFPALGELSRELLFYQRSPTFCERDPSVDFPGTAGRRCNRTSQGTDSCASLCCGRGYDVFRQRRVDRCHCRFLWCCRVACQNCTVEEWVTVCK